MTRTKQDQTGTRVVEIPTEQEARTVPMLFAARAAFGMGRTAAYKAHREGTFPLEVIRAGGQLFVRTRDLRELLRLDEPSDVA